MSMFLFTALRVVEAQGMRKSCVNKDSKPSISGEESWLGHWKEGLLSLPTERARARYTSIAESGMCCHQVTRQFCESGIKGWGDED